MKKTSAVFAFLCALALSHAAHATTIQLTVGAGGNSTDLIIGEVFSPNDYTGGQATRDAAAVNGLLNVELTLGLDKRTGADPEYYRSATDFGSLPTATKDDAVLGSGISDGSRYVDITLTKAFTYLVAQWDGEQAGAEVYYVGDLKVGDTIQVLRYAHPDGVGNGDKCGGIVPNGPHTGDPQPSCGNLVEGSNYLMTSWTLLNPTTEEVPDGGTTLSLLGGAVLALGALRRKVGR